MRRILKAIQEKLLAGLRSKQQLEDELMKILPLLKDQGLYQGQAYEKISHLISVCKEYNLKNDCDT